MSHYSSSKPYTTICPLETLKKRVQRKLENPSQIRTRNISHLKSKIRSAHESKRYIQSEIEKLSTLQLEKRSPTQTGKSSCSVLKREVTSVPTQKNDTPSLKLFSQVDSTKKS